MFGIPSFQAIINPPEPGILAVGAIVERAVGIDDEVAVRPLMTVTLSVDHRATSGADGARFLQTVTRYLEDLLLLLVLRVESVELADLMNTTSFASRPTRRSPTPRTA